MQIMSQSILSLRNATIYQEGKTILSDVNLEVKQGEFIYVIGKTGSGFYLARCGMESIEPTGLNNDG